MIIIRTPVVNDTHWLIDRILVFYKTQDRTICAILSRGCRFMWLRTAKTFIDLIYDITKLPYIYSNIYIMLKQRKLATQWNSSNDHTTERMSVAWTKAVTQRVQVKWQHHRRAKCISRVTNARNLITDEQIVLAESLMQGIWSHLDGSRRGNFKRYGQTTSTRYLTQTTTKQRLSVNLQVCTS